MLAQKQYGQFAAEWHFFDGNAFAEHKEIHQSDKYYL